VTRTKSTMKMIVHFSVLLFEVVTIDLHYMTDRQERFDRKILWKKDTYILDALEVR